MSAERARTIDTVVGPASVLHRLRLGIECVDGFLDEAVTAALRVGWECDATHRSKPIDRRWPCIDMRSAGMSRFKLGDTRPLPSNLVVRIDDPSRRYVPRRLALDPWPADALEEKDDQGQPQPYLPVRSRLVRMWLLPGSAYSFPRGATVVRGRVTRGGKAARWARIQAIGPTDDIAGRAHADDRGEFVLVVSNPGQNPVRSWIPIELNVAAPRQAVAPDVDDRCADLVAEPIPRSSVPATDAELDNDLLRGIDPPPGYAPNDRDATPLSVPAGEELLMIDPIEFEPNL